MTHKRFLVTVLSSLLFSVASMAQDDPFGVGGADPFGKDPFGVPASGKDADTQAQPKPAGRPAAVGADATIDATESLRQALIEKTSLSVVETPLVEALKLLSEQHDIPIIADVRALEEIGIGSDIPITISLKNVSLRSTLRLMLAPLDLTYMIKNEVLIITTPEHAERNLTVRMYAVPETLSEKSDQVIRALTASVVPQMWEATGGPCSVAAVDHVLVVSATETLHEEVTNFINKLDEAFKRHQAKKRSGG